MCQAKIKDRGEASAEDAPSIEPKFPIVCLPTQCIFCMGNTQLAHDVRKKRFASRDGLSRHFRRKHLRHRRDDGALQCPHPECNEMLDNNAHLQNHAACVHRTVT